MTKLEELKKKHSELKKEIKKESASLFKEACQDIFKKYPNLTRFAWTQYTPYFNDGDECVFGVNNYDIFINDLEEYYCDREDKKELKDAKKEITKMLQSIDDDIFYEMFGDHCKVIVTAKDITVKQYQHD